MISLYQNVLAGSLLQANLTALGTSWRRTTGHSLGYLAGTFEIEGEVGQLATWMNQWLGHHLVEKANGITWEGIVVDLELRDVVVRRRSLNEVWNRVRVFFGELLENTGFETDGAGPPTFESWSETVGGNDTIGKETTAVGTGSAAAKLSYVDNGTTFIYQNVTVQEKTTYRFSFYSRGDGTREGRFRVQDFDNTADIVALVGTGNSSTDYRRVSEDFTTPAGCTSLRVYLYVPSAAGDAYFDDVSVQLLVDGKVKRDVTSWAAQTQSRSQFGTREKTLDGELLTPAAAVVRRDAFLAAQAWPRMERLSQQGRRANERPRLIGTAIGYGLTTDWVYTSQQQHGSSGQADALMTALLGECEFIETVVVQSNSQAVRLDMKEKRVRQAIEAVVATGDASGNPWRFYMTANRTAVYEQVDFAPRYQLRNGRFKRIDGGRQISPWLMVPGVVRDADFPRAATFPDSVYEDVRDFLLDEVVVDNGSLSWRVGDF